MTGPGRRFEGAGSWLRTYLHPSRLVPAMTAGVVIGLLEVVLVASFAAVIFGGRGAVNLPDAIGFNLFAAVAEAPVPLVACEEPEADRNLGGVEELTRKRDHAVHEVGLDDVLADLALARGIGGYGAVGEHEAREACGY